jgi:hypothetical protein
VNEFALFAFSQKFDYLLSSDFQFDNSPLFGVMGQFASVLEFEDGAIKHVVIFLKQVVVVPLSDQFLSLLLEIALSDL